MTTDGDLEALATADLPSLGRRVRDARLAKGLRQQDIAANEISAAYVSRIEAGQRRPDLAIAQRLAERLGTSVLFLATGVDPEDTREALLTMRYAELALRSGEADDAASQLEQLRERASDLGALTHQVAYLLGLAREAQGRLDAAALLLEDVVTSEVGVASLQAAIALCRCYRDAGDLARSIEIGESASQRAGAEGLVGTDDELRLTLTLVAAYFERGDVVYASQLCQRAIARADTEQSSPARAAAYWNASVIASERGQSREALRMADRALALLSEGDDRRNIARLKLQYGAILLVQDDPDLPSALDHLEQARVELASTDASAADIARCDVELARALFLLGDFDEATSRASGALTGLGPTAPLVAAEGNVVLGRVAAARGDMAEAHHRYRRAVGLLTAAQADREVAQLWYQLGGLLEQAGDDGGARDAFRSAAASMGLRPDVGSSVSA